MIAGTVTLFGLGAVNLDSIGAESSNDINAVKRDVDNGGVFYPVAREELRDISFKQYIIDPKQDSEKDSVCYQIKPGRYEVWLEGENSSELVKHINIENTLNLIKKKDSEDYEVWSGDNNDFRKLMDYEFNKKTILIRNPSKRLVRVPMPVKEHEINSDYGDIIQLPVKPKQEKLGSEKPTIHYNIDFFGNYPKNETEKRDWYDTFFKNNPDAPSYEEIFPSLDNKGDVKTKID